MKKLIAIVVCGLIGVSGLHILATKKIKKHHELVGLEEKVTYHCDPHTEFLDAEQSYARMLQGYELFRKKYVNGDTAIMECLAHHGQKPHTMIVACCDSRVEPAVILQCDPGDLFVVRNVANIVAPCEHDHTYHSTGAALEFGICTLKVKHLILLGHSQCGGVKAAMSSTAKKTDDFITNWVSLIKMPDVGNVSADEYARLALHKSHAHCLTFPWIKEKVKQKELEIHLWFFDIETGQLFSYSEKDKIYKPL